MLTRSIAIGVLAAFAAFGAQAQTKNIKVQSSWPASLTIQDHLRIIADRVDKVTGGQVKIEAMPAGQIVPAFEVLDAANAPSRTLM